MPVTENFDLKAAQSVVSIMLAQAKTIPTLPGIPAPMPAEMVFSALKSAHVAVRRTDSYSDVMAERYGMLFLALSDITGNPQYRNG